MSPVHSSRDYIRKTVGLYVIIYTYLQYFPWRLGGVRITSLPSYIVDHPPPSTHQRITLLATLIHQLPTPLHIHDWQSHLESFPLRRRGALDLVREGHVLRKQTQLFQRRRMVPADVFMTQSITAHSNDTRERYGEWLSGGRDTGKQPGNFFGVGKREDELVDYTVDAYGSGDEGEGGVGRIAEDEVVRVECCESLLAYASAGGWSVFTVACNAGVGGWAERYVRHSRNVVDIWLIHHRSHRLLHIPLAELELGVLFPHSLQIEERAAEQRLQESQTPRMRNARASLVVMLVAWKHPFRIFCRFFVPVGFDDVLRGWHCFLRG